MKKSILALGIAAAFLMDEAQDGTQGGAGGAATPEKKVKFAAKEYDLDTGLLEIKFGDGETISVNVFELPDAIKTQLMLHGAAQKLGDSYAGAKGDYSVAKSSVNDVVAQLQSGDWRAAGGEGEAKPRIGELAEAVARVKGVDVDSAKSAVEKMTDEQRKAVRAHPRIKAAIATIRAEKAQAELAKAEASGEVEVAGL